MARAQCWVKGESTDLFISFNIVIIPAYFGANVVKIEVDVIEYDIPMLWSIEVLKKDYACSNIKNESVKFFGE